MVDHVATPQAVVQGSTMHALVLVLTIRPGHEQDVREVLPDLSGLVRAVGRRAPAGRLSMVTGIGAGAWDRLFGDPRPRHLHVLPEFRGARHTAPSTPGDLLFHVRADRHDLCHELATHVARRLEASTDLEDEVHGFVYFDDRDLTGFVDGTENPVGDAALAAALVGADDDPDFEAGSYVIVQRYCHHMGSWDSLTTEEQERVMGRTKLDDIELADDVQPPDSHVALTTVEQDGVGRDILRANMAYGSVRGDDGTYFIGYAADPAVTELMLERMFVGDGAGHTDRLLDFSVPLTGTLFFCPAQDLLDEPPPARTDHEPAAETRTPHRTDLGVGSLRGIQ